MALIQPGVIIALCVLIITLFNHIKNTEIKRLESKVSELENLAPDALLERIQIRFKVAEEEIKKLLVEKQIDKATQDIYLEQVAGMDKEITILVQRLRNIQKQDPMIVRAFVSLEDFAIRGEGV